LIEAWWGFEKIYGACRDAGLPEAHIMKDSEGLWIELEFPGADDREDNLGNGGDNRDESLPSISKKFGESRFGMLLLMMKTPRISVSELAE
jgi:hypothetical protein